MEDIEALNSVLATVAAKLDDLEKRVADQNLHDGIYTEIDRRRPFRIPIADLCNVQRELERLALGQRRPCGRVIANLDSFLIRAHVKYKSLKDCKDELKNCDLNEYLRYSHHLDELDKSIHALLTRRGLHRTMSAVVRGGITFTDVAGDRQIHSNPAATQPKSLNILLATKHWKDEEWPVDFSINGQIGNVPVLAIYRLADDNKNNDIHVLEAKRKTPAMPSNLFALHRFALIYEFHINANVHTPGGSELSFFGGLGQTRLWDRDTNIDHVQKSSAVKLVQNGPGLSAFRVEWGAEYKLYAQELDIVHHDKSLLSPVFNFALGCRLDERLRAWPGLDRPARGIPRRTFARLGFDLWRVFGRRRVEDKGKIKSFGIRLVADREWGGNFPVANRLLIEADVNLSKLLMGTMTND